jgi:GNAT superfamily N-acetyltransferase
MNIRELKDDDLKELMTLYSHLHLEDSPVLSKPDIKKVWNQIQSNDCIKYFGGFVGKDLISSCTITITPNLTRSCRPYGLIENVVTHANHRFMGYGKVLLQSALKMAWSHNCYKVMLMTGRLDEGTYKFYESVGFKRNEKEAFIAKP